MGNDSARKVARVPSLAVRTTANTIWHRITITRLPVAVVMTVNSGMDSTMNAMHAAMSIRRRPRESDRRPMRKIEAM